MEARIRPNDASCASVRQPRDARGGGAAALGGRGAGGWPWPSSLRLAVGLAGRLCCLSSGAQISPAVLAARTDSVGGVVGASMDGKIVCANTLDERLAVAHDTNLPVIRKRLFGE